MPSLEEVRTLADSLPDVEREALAEHLFNSLPHWAEVDDDIDEEELQEALRRREELRQNPEIGMTLEQMNAFIRQHRS